jgi:serine O-acetyltransferase
MIRTKKALEEYLAKDRFALGETRKRPLIHGNQIWKFEIILRKHEYYKNTGSNKLLEKYYSFRHNRLGLKLGFTIPCNVFEGGLRINHLGCLVISHKAKIGEFCDVHQGVNIGENIDGCAPVLGSNVWLGPGAKLFGDIYIADKIMVGANAVVNKSCPTPSVTLAGAPATIIKQRGNVYARDFQAEKATSL